ncbi:type I restriction enzyme S subunit [Nocardioides aromaticivorans]|uniref:Type I restriction enzyme S subunit n=1 Tax=Nocardioides aromaticivorans TaxID=200618 RepID=A0A7Y9ZIC7_9ACTN|nr:hypothetical protein [Nocardioides aromaticivorans]NYI44873.1 type I restriction enzyme S subunit [Nocardioides aromaticivorans]
MMIPLGRLVDLVTAKATDQSFKIGLEAIEPGTGRMTADPLTDYDGDGIGFEPGDVLFGKLRPYLAKAWLADRRGAAVGEFHVYRPCADRVDPGYLRWALLGRSFLDPVESSVVGAKMPRAEWTFVRSIELHAPHIAEQRAVAGYLDRETARIDSLIEEQERLIEMLRERRAAAVSEAASEIETRGPRLKHIIRSVRQGWSPQCYAWPADGVETWAVLKAGAANGGTFRPMQNKELPETESPRPEIVVRRGDLIVSRANTRELVGSAAVVDGEFPRLMLCDKLYAFSLDETRALPRYVAAVLGSRRWRDMIEMEATGASHSMLNVSQSDIVNLPMPLPRISDQRRILARLDEQTAKIDTTTAETERFIELSKERRSALITAAVTGQIDVREVV